MKWGNLSKSPSKDERIRFHKFQLLKPRDEDIMELTVSGTKRSFLERRSPSPP